MGELLTAFTDRVQALHKAPGITDPEVDVAVEQALVRYSQDLPIQVTLALDSATSYDLPTLVSGWDERYQVKELLKECSSGKRLPLDGSFWAVYDDTTLKVFCTTSSLRLVYTKPHTVNDSTSTIRASDLHEVANLAASFVCDIASRNAADRKSSTVAASTVDYGAIAEKWRLQSERLLKKYEAHVSTVRGSGGCFGEWDLRGGIVTHRSTWF